MTSSLKKANKLYREGKFIESLAEYEKTIKNNPDLKDKIEANMLLVKKRIPTQNNEINEFSEKIKTEVFVGIAAIPERKEALQKTIESLIDQVDKIGVYLNNWAKIPDFLENDKIIVEGFNKEDLGDIGKFFWCEQHEGFYFTCDDDLIYPPDYVETTKNKIISNDYSVVVGWHGSVLLEPFKTYYDKNSRRVFTFSSNRPWDTHVHILGTGCSAYHTDFFKIKVSDFKHKNMADIFFSIKGQEQKIPFIVMEHKENKIQEHAGTKENSIYAHSHANESSKKNTHKLQNEFVLRNQPWVLNEFRKLKVLIIGRFESYSKGGIYKSCHLIKNHLEKDGHTVKIHDTQNPLENIKNKEFDLCWIYPGDPERPDFKTVSEKIEFLQSKQIPTIVNLSYLYEENRTEWIKETLISYNLKANTPVLGAVFTETAANDPLLNEVKNYICVVPAFFKVVVASTVFSGRLLQRLLFLFPLGVECHRPDGCPVACGT